MVEIKIFKRHNGRKRVISTYALASAEGVVVPNGLINNESKTVNYRRIEPPPPHAPPSPPKKTKQKEIKTSEENFLGAIKKASKKTKKKQKEKGLETLCVGKVRKLMCLRLQIRN